MPLRESLDSGAPPTWTSPVGGVLEAAGDGEQCALARSTGAHDRHEGAGVDREFDVGQGVHLGRTLAVHLGDAP